jgi:hypothetical protein
VAPSFAEMERHWFHRCDAFLLNSNEVDELLDSPEMEPYVKLAVAAMQGSDATAELDSLRQLPPDAVLPIFEGFGGC